MRRALLYTSVAALIGFACAGDTDTVVDDSTGGGVDAAAGGNPDAMASNPDAMASNPDAAASNPDATGGGVVDAGGSAGACDNPSDTAVWESEDVEGASFDCGNACIFDTAPNCVRDCLVETTGLSEPCAACFDALVGCMVANCAFQCFDPDSAGCETCRLEHCATPFTECSGF